MQANRLVVITINHTPATQDYHSPSHSLLTMVFSMSNESDSQTYEDRAWQYFLQLQPSITDVNAAAELAFRAVDAFERQLKRRTGRDG